MTTETTGPTTTGPTAATRLRPRRSCLAVPGSNPRVDLALSKIEALKHFLRQGIYETSSYEHTLSQLMGVA